jgi:peptide deformylase
MALRDVLAYPDPRLREKARPVTVFDEALKTLARDLAETMYAEPGIGLAATQIGVAQRVITIDVREEQGQPGELLKLVNPGIIESEGEIVGEEGCLSVPGIREDVKRAEKVKVRAQDLDGRELFFDAEGMLAVVFQHEIDHLDGMLFIDRLSPLKRSSIKKRLRREAEQAANNG